MPNSGTSKLLCLVGCGTSTHRPRAGAELNARYPHEPRTPAPDLSQTMPSAAPPPRAPRPPRPLRASLPRTGGRQAAPAPSRGGPERALWPHRGARIAWRGPDGLPSWWVGVRVWLMRTESCAGFALFAALVVGDLGRHKAAWAFGWSGCWKTGVLGTAPPVHGRSRRNCSATLPLPVAAARLVKFQQAGRQRLLPACDFPMRLQKQLQLRLLGWFWA